MNTTQKGIITLLKSAITGQTLTLPEGFDIEAADGIIQKQSLLPMAYQGAYHCGMDPDSEVMRKYQKQYLHFLLRSEQQMRALEQIFSAFDQTGIDYLPLKGCVLKKLYPQPEMRAMGDADILIRREQYEQIKMVMERIGFEEGANSSYDIHWMSRKLLAELHYRLFSEHQKDLCLYFEDGWSRAVKKQGSRYELSPEDTFVYIFAHMVKHFRLCGIGARQIVDLYVYRQAYRDMDEAQIEQTMNRIHLLDFYWNIRRLLTVWFEDAAADPVTDCITDYVFSGGSWGTTENKLYSEEVIRAKSAGKVKNSRLRSVFRALFPTLNYMQLSYNILYKHSWLYPFYWVVRWVDILIHHRDNARKKLKIIRGISDQKISAHQQALNYMGLDFYYEEAERESNKM